MNIRNRIHLATVLLAVVTAACASRTGVRPAETAPMQLSASDVTVAAELLQMEDARRLDTVLVARALLSASAEVRGRAALAAGRIGDRSATPILLRTLADPDNRVRSRAAFALGELPDSAATVSAALGSVALHDDGAAAIEAVSALGRIGTEAGREFINTLLTTRRPAPVVQAALLASWRLPRNEVTRDAVARHLRSDDAEVRWRAAYALARTMGPDAVSHLIPLTTDDDAQVRAQSVRGLRASLVDSAGLREQALSAIIARTRDSHSHARINAVALLPAYEAAARTLPVLLERLRDTDVNVAIAAAQAIGAAADSGVAAEQRAAAVNALYAAARTTAAAAAVVNGLAPGDGFRSAALAALARVDSAQAAAVATEWADSSRWILRMHAARALGSAPYRTVATTLQRLARDPNYLVAAQAYNSIRSATDSANVDARQAYIEGLSADHPLVRAAATAGLGRSASAANLDLLLQAYDRARADTMRDAAVAAVNALGRLRRNGVPVDRSFYLRFGQFGPPADAQLYETIASQIQNLPVQWGPQRSGQPDPRPLNFYVDIINRYVAPVLAGLPAPLAVIATPHGDITLELAAADAPLTVHNFLSLIERGYYVNNRWHRVVPNFVIQDGDPRGDGSGGPGYRIRDEINTRRYDRGALGMALSGPDTGGSQWFITHSPQPHLDGGYTIFGRVVDGMDVVDRVVQEEPILQMRSSR